MKGIRRRYTHWYSVPFATLSNSDSSSTFTNALGIWVEFTLLPPSYALAQPC